MKLWLASGTLVTRTANFLPCTYKKKLMPKNLNLKICYEYFKKKFFWFYILLALYLLAMYSIEITVEFKITYYFK